MGDDRRQPYVGPVELTALAKEFNAQVPPRRLSNAAYLIAFVAYVAQVVAAKAAQERPDD